LAKAAETQAKLIYFANPDNPMGSWHAAARVEAMVQAVPEGSLLVLDEAYSQFLPEGALPQIDADDPRVIRFRTFSKAYGLAGARVGYGIAAPGLIQAFNKVRNHFGMSRVSQAGALAALDDQAHLAEVTRAVKCSVSRIGGIAAENGLHALPTATNFVAIDCGRDGAFAKAVLDGLVERGVFVRMPFVAPQNRCIRVSCGPEPEMAVLAEALPQALEQARKIVTEAVEN
jgi:histidinol-phosphate aminotransferase